MPRSLTPDRQAELDSLYALTHALAEFHSAELSAELAAQLREVVERTYRESSLPGMREIRDDMLAATEGTLRDPPKRHRLDVLLRERTGHGLAHYLSGQQREIAKIRQRGFITTDRQYYLLKEHLELIATDPDHQDAAVAVQELLTAYEERTALRGRGKDRDPAA
jgi:hypothetical protein